MNLRDASFALLLAFAFPLVAFSQHGFLQEQLRVPRVRQAHDARFADLQTLLRERQLPWPPEGMFVRIFKGESELEVWMPKNGRYEFVKTYPICAMSGGYGPKTRQGDLQVPEGVYSIDALNPRSDYHLSMHVDYPNTADRRRSEAPDLGGDIYIHGRCGSIGCVAIDDGPIEELYLLYVYAREGGTLKVPVHVFPMRLTPGNYGGLRNAFPTNDVLCGFWESLVPVYEYFEKAHRIPDIRIDEKGKYSLSSE